MEVRRGNHVTVTGREGGPVAPALEQDFRVILFDHAGAGRWDLSAWSAERYASLDGCARDVLEICRDLAPGPVVFAGHSVSAVTGVPAAGAEAGHRGGAGAEDIGELPLSLEPNHLGRSAATAPVVMGNPERPEPGQELTHSFCRTDPGTARVLADATLLFDNRADLAPVPVPNRVAHCSGDAIAPPEVGAFVHAQITDGRLVTRPATGYCPQLGAPGAASEAIAPFAPGAGR